MFLAARDVLFWEQFKELQKLLTFNLLRSEDFDFLFPWKKPIKGLIWKKVDFGVLFQTMLWGLRSGRPPSPSVIIWKVGTEDL